MNKLTYISSQLDKVIFLLEVLANTTATPKRSKQQLLPSDAQTAAALEPILPKLRGNLTATEVAKRAGIEPRHRNLQSIGRVLDSKGVPRGRTQAVRFFRF